MTIRHAVWLLVALAAVSLSPARAAETGGCDRFAWDIGDERARLAAARPQPPADAPPVAFRLAMRPIAEVALPMPPERLPRSGAPMAAFATVVIQTPGIYRVTLSEAGWIDAIQGATYLKVEAFSGVGDCPGIRKSVKFRLLPGVLTLQITGPDAETSIAVTPDR